MPPIRPARPLITALLLLLACGSAYAHHSFNMFDMAKTVTLTGTVKEVQWSNPHVILVVTVVPKSPDQPAEWSVECTSPGNLVRMGWNRKSFKPGDHVAVEISPLRDGNAGGAFRHAKLLDTGEEFTASLKDAEKAGQQ